MFQRSGLSRKALGAAALGLALAGSFAAPPAAAQDVVIAQEIDGPYIVTWASANVRALPTVESDLLAELTLGQFVDVTGVVEGEE